MGASKEEYSARRRRRHRSTGHRFRHGTSTLCAAVAKAFVYLFCQPPPRAVKPTHCRLPSPLPEPPPMRQHRHRSKPSQLLPRPQRLSSTHTPAPRRSALELPDPAAGEEGSLQVAAAMPEPGASIAAMLCRGVARLAPPSRLPTPLHCHREREGAVSCTWHHADLASGRPHPATGEGDPPRATVVTTPAAPGPLCGWRRAKDGAPSGSGR